MCITSAQESLHIVSEDFHGMKLLVRIVQCASDVVLTGLLKRYGQESITVMTAYSAIFLLKASRRLYGRRRILLTALPAPAHAEHGRAARRGARRRDSQPYQPHSGLVRRGGALCGVDGVDGSVVPRAFPAQPRRERYF